MQCRMARAGLGWNLRRLAQEAGVGLNTANNYELGGDALVSKVEAIRRTFEAAGVTFLQDDGEGAGVRVKAIDGR